MLTIRLQRVGKTKKPTYRLVISEKARDTQDVYLELLGSFNPHVKENQLVAKADRITYWISKGATMSPTVNNLFIKAGIVPGKMAKSVFLSQKRSAKIAEKSAKGGSASGGKTEAMPSVEALPPAAEPAPQPEAGPPVAEVVEPAPVAPDATPPAPEAVPAETSAT